MPSYLYLFPSILLILSLLGISTPSDDTTFPLFNTSTPTHFYPKFYPNIFTEYLYIPEYLYLVHLYFTSRTLFAKIFKPFINNRRIHHLYHSLIYIHFHKSTLLKITLSKIQKCQTIINKLTNEIRLNSWNWHYLRIAFS